MIISNIKNPQYVTADNSRVICDIDLDGSPCKFVAAPDDCTEHGRQVYADCVAGKYGEIAAYVAPEETQKVSE